MFWSKGSEEFRFLSNFQYSPFTFGGEIYRTVEHFYQANKMLDPAHAELIRKSWHGAEAKKLSEKYPAVANWDVIKYDVMLRGTRMKFAQNANFREMLVATDGFELVHYAPWGDTYWGVDKNMIGENTQGKILMLVRSEICQKIM